MASLGDLVVNLSMDTRNFTSGARTAQGVNDRLANSITQKMVTALERNEMAQARVNKMYAQGRISAETYQRALDELGAEYNQLTTTSTKATQAAGRFGAAGSRSSMIMSQMAFAVEDASVSFGTGGLQGALRGATNNINMMLMMLPGATGAIAALGFTTVTTLIPSLLRATGVIGEQVDTLKEYQKELDALQDRMSNLRAGAETRVATEIGVRDIGRIETSSAAREAEERANDESRGLAAQLHGLEDEKSAIEQTMIRSDLEANRGEISFEDRDKRNAEAAERLRSVKQQILEVERELTQQNKLATAAHKQAVKLAEQERDARAETNAELLRTFAKRAAGGLSGLATGALESRQSGLDSAGKLGAKLALEIDPDETRAAQAGIMDTLAGRLSDIAGIRGITDTERSGLTEQAKLAAATGLAGLEQGPSMPGNRPAEAMQKGSKDALQTILQSNLSSKETPKEVTQKSIDKHLANIEKTLKNGPGLSIGLFGASNN